MWASAISSRLDAVLARALTDSPRAQQLTRELAGRSVDLELVGTGWAIRLRSDGERLELGAAARAAQAAAAPGGAGAAADARISGGALALLALSGPDPEAVVRRGGLRVDGDAEVADRFRELARLLRPDLEHELGRAVGPVPAHLAVRAARGALGWGRRALRATLRNTADYLAHERRDLVPVPEFEHVLRAAEALREHLDRLEARLGELQRRLAVLRGSGYAGDR
jgi:ubiquinone biosynthesis protein UbiJ